MWGIKKCVCKTPQTISLRKLCKWDRRSLLKPSYYEIITFLLGLLNRYRNKKMKKQENTEIFPPH